MTEIKRMINDGSGKKLAVYYYDDGEAVWLRFAGESLNKRQVIPPDRYDYRYTHGGRLYRAACDRYWREL